MALAAGSWFGRGTGSGYLPTVLKFNSLENPRHAVGPAKKYNPGSPDDSRGRIVGAAL